MKKLHQWAVKWNAEYMRGIKKALKDYPDDADNAGMAIEIKGENVRVLNDFLQYIWRHRND